jgi:hypothetical protein
MTAPALDVRPSALTEPILVRRPPIGPLWRRALLRGALVPLTVLAPIVALAPTADHRFNIYWHGGLFRDDPLRIVPQTLASVPGYLQAGNFRPLGRMLEKSLDLIAYTLGELFGVPANVAFRLVEFVSAILLTIVAVLLAESVVARGPMLRRPPSTLAAVVPFAVGAGFVAAGRTSPAVLFGGLYFASAALVLGVVAVLCRVGAERRIRARWWPALMLGGAALASFNELTYFTLPLATVALAVRGRLVLGLPWPRLRFGVLIPLWLGFLPVFAAVRLVIRAYCAAGRCYHGSDVTTGPAVLAALPARLVAWFPPLMWWTVLDGRLSGLVLVFALVVLAVLAGLAIRDLPRLSRVDRPAALALVAVAGTLLLLGAALAALNGDVQQIVAAHRWGQGWRDTAVTAVAGALLLAALAHLAVGRRRSLIAVIVLLAAGSAVSATANERFRDDLMNTPAARLDDRLAQEMADFDPSPAGAARRCELRGEFFAQFAGSPFSRRRFDQSFDTAAEQRAGVPFCVRVTR